MVKSSASVPSFVQVTSPMGVPVTVGCTEVHGVFSATVAFDNPVMVSVAVSRTSVTVTVIAFVAVLSSASVTLTVTS